MNSTLIESFLLPFKIFLSILGNCYTMSSQHIQLKFLPLNAFISTPPSWQIVFLSFLSNHWLYVVPTANFWMWGHLIVHNKLTRRHTLKNLTLSKHPSSRSCLLNDGYKIRKSFLFYDRIINGFILSGLLQEMTVFVMLWI